MASNAMTAYSASTLVLNNRASSSPLPLGLGPHFGLSPKHSLKVPSSGPSGLMVKAQQRGSPKRRDYPMSAEQFSNALSKTSPHERTPWNTTEEDNEIKMSTMWFNMPGLGPENTQVEIVDDLLVIKGGGGVDGFGKIMSSPYDSKVQLPSNSWKEEITAVYKNGVLYINVPKIKFDHKIIHIPVRSAY